MKNLHHLKTITQRQHLYTEQVTSLPSLGYTKEIKLLYSLAKTMFFSECDWFIKLLSAFSNILFSTDTRTDSNALINAKESHTTTTL